MSEVPTQDAKTILDNVFFLDDDAEQAVYTCRHCRCQSTYAEGFIENRQKNSNPTRYTCISCAAYKEQQTSGPYVLFQWAMMAWVVWWVSSGDLSRFAGFVLVCFFLQYLIIFFHELGHYFAARMQGLKVPLMIVGAGPVLKVFRFGEQLIVFKLFPTAGSVLPDLSLQNKVRSKFFLCVLAGPAVNLGS